LPTFWLAIKAPFGQAAGPFTEPRLSEAVNYPASTAECELIHKGGYDSETLKDVTQLLVRHFSQRQLLDCLPHHITREEFLAALKVWKEGTSTSPSGMNLGHYHTLFRRHKYKADGPETLAFEEKQARLVDAQVALLNCSLQFSHSFNRWRTIVNVMILKEPGNAKIHGLWVIHIYEAD
jgi:hypothetical protein